MNTVGKKGRREVRLNNFLVKSNLPTKKEMRKERRGEKGREGKRKMTSTCCGKSIGERGEEEKYSTSRNKKKED